MRPHGMAWGRINSSLVRLRVSSVSSLKDVDLHTPLAHRPQSPAASRRAKRIQATMPLYGYVCTVAMLRDRRADVELKRTTGTAYDRVW